LPPSSGKPFEGNYSGWLAKKAQLMAQMKRQDDALQKSLESELEWVRSNPKARQTKSKARLSRYG
jgi:sulfate-transporting ATPase